MLVVAEVQPGAAADGQLAVGDVLVAIDGKPMADFDALDALLDDRVGGQVEIVGRARRRHAQGHAAGAGPARDHARRLPRDRRRRAAHAVLADGAPHERAGLRRLRRESRATCWASAGIPRGAVLTELDGKPLKNLDDALAIFADARPRPARDGALLHDGGHADAAAHVDPHRPRLVPGAATACATTRSGSGPARRSPAGPDAPPPKPGTTRFARTGDKLVDALAPSLVLVEFNMPYSISGVTERNYHGTGVVIDAVRGLVAVDRNTVPVSLGDVRLTFAGTVEVDATVEYVHPLHNLAVVRYDPRQLGDTPVQAVKLRRAHAGNGGDGARRRHAGGQPRRFPAGDRRPRSGRSGSRCRGRSSSATRTSRSCGWSTARRTSTA